MLDVLHAFWPLAVVAGLAGGLAVIRIIRDLVADVRPLARSAARYWADEPQDSAPFWVGTPTATVRGTQSPVTRHVRK